MASAADPMLRYGRPKNASAPPWRSQQSQQSQPSQQSQGAEEAPPWRRRKDLRNEPQQVTMQQGGSSASDSRPLPSEDKTSEVNPSRAQLEAPVEAPAPAPPAPPTPPASPAPPALPAPAGPAAPEAPAAPSAPATAASAETKDVTKDTKDAKDAKDESRVFEIGEKVRYWSGTHAKWVEAHVQRINRGPDGDLISYDLTAKAQADISRVKDASTAEDAPPPVAPARVPPPESNEKALEKATVEKFEKGAEVQYFSETRERWIDAIVEVRHEKDDGSVMYDLNLKKGVPAERLRKSHVEYTVGEQVEYWSASSHRWMPAIVEKILPDAKQCDLTVKPGAPLSRVRKAPGSAVPVPQFFKAARTGSLSHGAVVPPPPLACSFKGGDQVQYYSETKHKWMETTVIRIFELDGNICYDLECKKNVFADKVRSSVRASQERFEAGEAVEYWSVSAGRWLSARVTKVRSDLGQCDLDIKLAAPNGRLRRPQVTPPGPLGGPPGPGASVAPAGNSNLFVKPSPPQIELPELSKLPPDLPDPSPPSQSPQRAVEAPKEAPKSPPAPEAPPASSLPPAAPAAPAAQAPETPVVASAGPAVPILSSPASPASPGARLPKPLEPPEPEMEPTEGNKDIDMKPTEPLKPAEPTVPPAFSPPAVPSVPSISGPTEQPEAKQADDVPGQSAATAVTPAEPVQKPHVPRPLPQPRHIQIAKQDAAAQSNGTLNTAKPPNEEKAEPRQERQEMREETPEEEVDYDDDNDDNDDDDDDDDDAEKLEEEEEAKDEKDEKDEPMEASEGETKGGTSRQAAQNEVEIEAASTIPEETQQVQVSEKHKKSRRRHHKNNDGHEKERRRRRRKHKDHQADPDQNGPETGPASKDSPRPDPNTNGAERGSRRRRRHATDAQNQGHGYHTEPGGIEASSKGRRRRSSGASPGADVPANDELPRATPWNSDREGRRRAPPGATAKALPRPFQRDVRDRDSSRGVCDLMGAAQDAIKTVEWNRLVLAQEQAMERDKSDGPRQKLRRPASASPLKRKIPLSRRPEGRDVRLVSREPARRHRSRSRHHSRGRRR